MIERWMLSICLLLIGTSCGHSQEVEFDTDTPHELKKKYYFSEEDKIKYFKANKVEDVNEFLAEAIRVNDKKLVSLILKKYKRDFIFKHGITLAHMAASIKDCETQKLLMSYSTYMNKKDIYGLTPLKYAVLNEKKELEQEFLKRGAEKDKYYMLTQGIISSDFTDMTETDGAGHTLLHWAVFSDNSEIIRKLIHAGCPLNAVNIRKETCLHYAATYKKINALRTIMTSDTFKNEYVDLKAHNKCSALTYAVRANSFPAVKLLVDAGADVNSKSHGLYTPLHLAVSRKNIKMVRYLIENGAEVNAITDFGNTPLDVAIRKKCLQIFEYLKNHGGKVGIKKEGYIKEEFIKKPKTGK